MQALQAQRPLLGDGVVDTALGPLRAELAQLRGNDGPRLKLVTVMFADIVGSTALSRGLVPEEIHRVMDGALAAFTGIVHRHGGQVLQYAGDGLLAVFGALRASEDDAVQAVRAGLALQDEARVQAGRVGQRHGGLAFALRVGISSGEVLLGQGVDEGASIRGMPVNLAARMEQTAPPGGLRVSHDTWAQLHGRFEADAEETLMVKGCDAPVRSWLVRREREPAAVGGHGPLLGREAELDMLRQALDAVAAGRGPAALLWLGEAGVGKSRLLAEAAQVAQRRDIAVQVAGAGHQPAAAPYALLRRWFGPAEVAGSPWVMRLFGPRDALDPADAQAVRDRGFAALLAHCRARAAAHPLLVCLDDLQTADEGSLEFLRQLLQTPGPLPLLLLAAARPGADEPRLPAQRRPLAPLDPAAAEALAAWLLAPCGLPGLAALLAERGECIPVHMEELAAMWREQGLLEPGAAADLQRFGADAVPPSLPAVLQARLDRLPAAERAALQAASVIGPSFWDAALEPADRAWLPALQARGLVLPQPEADLGPAQAFRFRHRHLHERVYAGVLGQARRRGHQAAADWLARQPGGGQLAACADHLERAGDTRRAAEEWARAGADAAARWANRDARMAFERALQLGSDAPPLTQLRQRQALQEVLIRLADAAAQQANVAEMAALAPLLDPLAQAEVALCRAECEHDAGRPAAALEALAQLFAVVPDGAHRLRGRALGARAAALRLQGRTDEALACLAQALPCARRAGDRRNEAALLNSAGMLAMDQGEAEAARAHFVQALALHRESGHQGNEAATLANLGYLDWVLGDPGPATDLFGQAAALAGALGQAYNEGLARVNLSLVLGQQGDASAALVQSQAALALLAPAADPCALAAAQRAQGLAQLALGRLAVAEAAFVAARDSLDALGLERLAVEAIAGLAAVALARGDLDGARRAAVLVLERAGPAWRMDGLDEPERVCLACFDALRACGDPGADAVLAAGWSALQARAARIADPARRLRLLAASPLHRRLQALADAGLRTTGS